MYRFTRLERKYRKKKKKNIYERTFAFAFWKNIIIAVTVSSVGETIFKKYLPRLSSVVWFGLVWFSLLSAMNGYLMPNLFKYI